MNRNLQLPASSLQPLAPNFDRFAHYYDADMGEFADDLPLYREWARRSDGPILDAMCGTGRVVVPLAEAGFEVVGLDVSAAMLAVAENKRAARGLEGRLRLHQGDVRAFELEDRFGLVLVPLNSFMHLETVGDQLAALRAIHRHMQPNGLLVLDLFNPDPRELAGDQGALIYEHTFRLPEGNAVQKYVLRRSDVARQQQQVEFIYDELDAEGRVTRHALPFTMRWLYRYEAEHLLDRAGFVLEQVYGDYDLEPYGSDSPQLILLARRA
jgi:SAM-dependent methyltransferase